MTDIESETALHFPEGMEGTSANLSGRGQGTICPRHSPPPSLTMYTPSP